MIQSGRLLLAALCAFGLIPLAGCGPRYVPVSGTVTLDGKPLQGGVIRFTPDTSKGNTAHVSCTGPVQDGHYTLRTIGVTKADTGSGAALGWYKVSLFTNLPGQPRIEVNSKYTSVEKTPLSIEVVDNPEPGHYDIKLDK
jgi:hypothetical protein